MYDILMGLWYWPLLGITMMIFFVYPVLAVLVFISDNFVGEMMDRIMGSGGTRGHGY